MLLMIMCQGHTNDEDEGLEAPEARPHLTAGRLACAFCRGQSEPLLLVGLCAAAQVGIRSHG